MILFPERFNMTIFEVYPLYGLDVCEVCGSYQVSRFIVVLRESLNLQFCRVLMEAHSMHSSEQSFKFKFK